MSLKHLLTTLPLVAICSIAVAQRLTPLQPDTAVLQGRLPNGLTYIIRHNELPKNTADFYIAQKVGAILEEDNQNGLAHFLEHMAFNGTKNFPGKKIIDFLERVGVRFGENINAYTSLDETVYNLVAVPTTDPAIVDSALLVLHDWSGYISLEAEEIDKERGVIREEWRQTASAGRRLYFGHMAATMPGTQYAKRDVIGDTAVINNFAYDELRAYYKKWYRPDLQAIVVVGDVNPRHIETRIRQMWQDIPAPIGAAERKYVEVPLNTKPVVSILDDDEATNTTFQVQYRYHAVPDSVNNSVEYTRHQIVAALATMVANSRFSEKTTKGAPFAGAQMGLGNLTPTLCAIQFYCVANDGQTAQSYTALLDEIEKLRRFGVGENELSRAKDNIIAQYENNYLGRNKVRTGSYVHSYYNSFLSGDVITSAAYDRELINTLVPNITTTDVKNFINEYLNVPPVTLVSAVKTDKAIATAQAYTDEYNGLKNKPLQPVEDKTIDTELASVPTPGTIVGWEDDPIYGARIAVLSNGLNVYMLPTRYSDNQILLSGGSHGGYSKCEPADVPSAALASVIHSTMGLGKYSRPDLSKALSGKRASVSVNLSTYGESVYGNSSIADFETMLQLVYLNFTEPRQDDEAFSSLMTRFESQLVNARQDPDNVFSDTIHYIMGNGNPYRVHISRPSDLKNISLDKALEVYSSRFSSARGFTFTLVGSFDTDSIAPIMAKWLGALPTSERSSAYKPRNLFCPDRNIDFSMSLPMKTEKNTCYICYTNRYPYTWREALCIDILGRILDLRYTESMREDEGGTYGVGVRGSLSRMPDEEYSLDIQFSTDPAVYDRLLPLVEKEIRQIAKKGPRADDLDKVRRNLIKKHEENLQTNGAWQSLLIDNILYGLDKRAYADVVNSISDKDIKRWAKQIVRKSHKQMFVLRPQK